MAARLRISRTTVLRWYRAGKIIGWKQEGTLCVPVWQFQEGKVLPGLAEVISVANKGWESLDDPGRMLFMLSNLSFLQGRRPLDLLRVGEVERAKEAGRGHVLCSRIAIVAKQKGEPLK